METLYLKVEIRKTLQDEREEINYYILENELYGIKITRVYNNTTFEKEEIVMEDIFKDENDAKSVIDLIVNQGNDLSQIEYVVEDYNKGISERNN